MAHESCELLASSQGSEGSISASKTSGWKLSGNARRSPSALTFLRNSGPTFLELKILRRLTPMTSRKPKSGQEDSLARTSASLEWDPGADSEASSPGSSTTLRTSLKRVAPKLSSSKTLRHSSLPTMDEISQSSFGRWPTSGMASRGEFLTVDTSASPKVEVESSLSDLLEERRPPDRYFLSPNAATGILRRVDRMGRKLLPPLRSALEILAEGSSRSSHTASTPSQHGTPAPTGLETTSPTLKDESAD